jgi:hypothetical protein
VGDVEEVDRRIAVRHDALDPCTGAGRRPAVKSSRPCSSLTGRYDDVAGSIPSGTRVSSGSRPYLLAKRLSPASAIA